MPRFVLGVTGAVGAGKSTLCRLLREHGFSVLDVDDVAAEALLQDQVRPFLLRKLEGALTAEGVPSKARIFSAMLRDSIFRDELSQELRPFVFRHVQTWKDGLIGPGALDAALLFESGLDALCDATLCVTCPVDERRRRVLARSTASALHFDAIEAAQWPESKKRDRARAWLSSEGPAAHLQEKLREVLKMLGQPL